MVLLWWHSVFLYVAHAILILLDFQEKIYQVNIFDFYRCSENSKRSKAQKLRTDDTKRFTVQLNGAHDFVLETFHYSYFILFYFLSLTVTQFLQIRKITEYQKKTKKKPATLCQNYVYGLLLRLSSFILVQMSAIVTIDHCSFFVIEMNHQVGTNMLGN